ncbi:acyl-CoA dehydrogenase [Nocardiopsis terrae]|uniref:Alkylation response protein AidB-like acyl-CoA dehydrogenase n=1 Tax=Nocardiopsis terrae TaxID=372655 RepID=A0ABR9HF36_9ACTN|nr:acyl-CoA dehydrogenase family protein [Nocardiopsis terrae]MBE1457638.1 alkylation response protein AidB-like acyl-CoA dehydrogenase [Nocardiopsis terrae]GHC85042.1 acyl-CoA dehydrogenase [Nocardiopsis terrae]
MNGATSRVPAADRRAPRPGGADDAHDAWVADELTRAVGAGELDLPFPGGGDTRNRWRALRDLAERDLSLARLAEGHTDAAAILAELGATRPGPGQVWGVWAAHPPGAVLTAVPEDGGWRLHGTKPFCSGAHTCTRALVSAEVDGGERRLFAVDTGGTEPVEGTWACAGMAASDTLTVAFDGVPADPVGPAGAYVRRPGFHHGGAGVAACWFGGALALAAPLAARAARDSADVHTRTAYGAVDRDLHAAGAVLELAADGIDADPQDTGGGAALRARRVRAVVARVCGDVLRRTGEALGAGPLAADARHARAAADLAVYLRQHHADRDLAVLGGQAAGEEGDTHGLRR